MIAFLLLVVAAAAAGQPAGDGVPLLRQVAEASRSAKSWRVEGTGEAWWSVPGATYGRFQFNASQRGTLESVYIFGRAYVVCDGERAWTRRVMLSLSAFEEQHDEKATLETCNPSVTRWGDLLDSLQAATIAGKDESRGCTIVKAEYDLPDGPPLGRGNIGLVLPIGLVAREMCVDEARKVILSERFVGSTREGHEAHVALTYDLVEFDPQFRPEEFQFPAAVPPGIRVQFGKPSQITVDDLNRLPVLDVN